MADFAKAARLSVPSDILRRRAFVTFSEPYKKVSKKRVGAKWKAKFRGL